MRHQRTHPSASRLACHNGDMRWRRVSDLQKLKALVLKGGVDVQFHVLRHVRLRLGQKTANDTAKKREKKKSGLDMFLRVTGRIAMDDRRPCQIGECNAQHTLDFSNAHKLGCDELHTI